MFQTTVLLNDESERTECSWKFIMFLLATKSSANASVLLSLAAINDQANTKPQCLTESLWRLESRHLLLILLLNMTCCKGVFLHHKNDFPVIHKICDHQSTTWHLPVCTYFLRMNSSADFSKPTFNISSQVSNYLWPLQFVRYVLNGLHLTRSSFFELYSISN